MIACPDFGKDIAWIGSEIVSGNYEDAAYDTVGLGLPILPAQGSGKLVKSGVGRSLKWLGSKIDDIFRGSKPYRYADDIIENSRTSKAGLYYPDAADDVAGTDRIEHVLDHYVENPTKPTHTIIEPSVDAFKLNDEAFASVEGVYQPRYGTYKYEYSPGYAVGTVGEDTWVLITRPDKKTVVTAFPKAMD